MTPDQPTALVEVTDADEDMAARFISRTDGDFPELAGLFARRARDARIAAMEEAARVADAYAAHRRNHSALLGWTVTQGRIDAAERIATAIREAREGSHDGE